jgi:hypothetical protein
VFLPTSPLRTAIGAKKTYAQISASTRVHKPIFEAALSLRKIQSPRLFAAGQPGFPGWIRVDVQQHCGFPPGEHGVFGGTNSANGPGESICLRIDHKDDLLGVDLSARSDAHEVQHFGSPEQNGKNFNAGRAKFEGLA